MRDRQTHSRAIPIRCCRLAQKGLPVVGNPACFRQSCFSRQALSAAGARPGSRWDALGAVVVAVELDPLLLRK